MVGNGICCNTTNATWDAEWPEFGSVGTIFLEGDGICRTKDGFDGWRDVAVRDIREDGGQGLGDWVIGFLLTVFTNVGKLDVDGKGVNLQARSSTFFEMRDVFKNLGWGENDRFCISVPELVACALAGAADAGMEKSFEGW